MSDQDFIQIGPSSLCSRKKIVGLASPDSAPVRRVIQEARDRKMLLDASAGRKTRSVILMESNHVILSAYEIDVLAAMLGMQESPEA